MTGLDNPVFLKEYETNGVEVPMDDYRHHSTRVVVGAVGEQYPPDGDAGARHSYRVSGDEEAAKHFPGKDKDQEEEQEEEEEDYNILTFLPCYPSIKKRITSITRRRQTKLWAWRLVLLVLSALYAAYFIAVLTIPTKIQEESYWCRGDGFLILITVIGVIGLLYFKVVKPLWGRVLFDKVITPLEGVCSKLWRNKWVRWGVYVGLVGSVVTFLVVDSRDAPRRLVSLFGIFVLLLFGFVFSVAPRKIRWRHVAWGMGLQFLLGLAILRWSLGRAVFQCAGDKVSAFLAFTDAGSSFVFGTLVSKDHIFAFQVLSVILFFSFCIQILYYWGVMQWVVLKLGWLLQVTVGTTACESVNAAANIFLGQTEAPLLIKPFIRLMTKSELHAVMTGGFATIAGSVLAAYISFGVDPVHLLSASVMSAPAALAFSKLFYPETKQSRTGVKDIKIEKGDEANWLHAAMVGVTNAIPLVANIAANLIAFYAFIALCSSVFDWSCTLAGSEPGVCSLESLFGWIFMPLAWVMGVEWSECDKVGQLIGIKTIVNEFVAYSRLAEMKKREELSKRAEIIATYALCGFSNISAIGINLGGFGAMAPERKADLAKVVVRAMIAGSCACFLTACVAGSLLEDIGRRDNITEAVNATQVF
ncbi:uncharacterized transporter YutK isoform X2 [Procambarus clarkii]|uniref:uncharacterized transporter YutK isoform X2 n=1 Tax=Procambarus clarkii TaxID=6728 RepID=UPI001E676E60|nr:solute carrier family 28 member 3-like [Procambarus clarkii]